MSCKLILVEDWSRNYKALLRLDSEILVVGGIEVPLKENSCEAFTSIVCVVFFTYSTGPLGRDALWPAMLTGMRIKSGVS